MGEGPDTEGSVNTEGCEINGKVHRGEKEKVQWKTKSKSRRNQEKDAQRADLKRTVCGDRG